MFSYRGKKSRNFKKLTLSIVFHLKIFTYDRKSTISRLFEVDFKSPIPTQHNLKCRYIEYKMNCNYDNLPKFKYSHNDFR